MLQGVDNTSNTPQDERRTGPQRHFQSETSLVNLFNTVRKNTSCRLFVCLTMKISTYAAPTVGVGWLVMSAKWCGRRDNVEKNQNNKNTLSSNCRLYTYEYLEVPFPGGFSRDTTHPGGCHCHFFTAFVHLCICAFVQLCNLSLSPRGGSNHIS